MDNTVAAVVTANRVIGIALTIHVVANGVSMI